MSIGSLKAIRGWPLAAAFLVALYGVFRQRTWSVDGCLHAMNADHFMDRETYPHLLLRPVTFLWVSLWRKAGFDSYGEWYGALYMLFALFGVAALTILFAIARRRAGEAAAWIALVTIALSRDALRHITVFDEKPLGMLTFALAVLATERLFRSTAERPAEPLGFRALLPAASAWALAVFGHLQNALFAIAFLGTLALWPSGPASAPAHRAGLVARAALIMALAGLALFLPLHWELGGLAAVPQILQSLGERPQPPQPAGFAHLWLGALQGWTKAFFLVDRLSPPAFPAIALAGFVVLALAALRGLTRRRDALGGMLLAGCLMLMLTMPLANSFPGYGDSYTMIVFAAFVLLASAPRRLLLAGAALVAIVNLPPAASHAFQPLTIQRHLAALIDVQRSRDSPWIVLDERSRFPGEQELAPVYYRMRKGLRFTSCGFDSLPPGPCLVDLPLQIGAGGAMDSGAVEAVRSEIERRGRTVRGALLWNPVRIIRSDFHAYGHYLIVDPATSPEDAPE